MRRWMRSLGIVLAMITLGRRSQWNQPRLRVNRFIVARPVSRHGGSAMKEDVMAVNARFAQVNTGTWSGPSLGRLLSTPARTARRAGRQAFDYFAQDAVTAREHRRRNVYEATGRQRGAYPSSAVVQFDLIDRYRAGF